jgi:hypothetical protein|tara:strand:- start:1095 stop:1895 length:801 start_codon:yes stop_codon:yes gene_type:complete
MAMIEGNYVKLGNPLNYQDLMATRSWMPTSTRSHVPIPHHEVWDLVQEEAKNFGFELGDPEFGTDKDHQRFFAFVDAQTDLIHPESKTFLALRNSHDKSFPVGLAIGKKVNVCNNLVFGGEVTVKVKHTTNLFDRIKPRLATAVSKLRAVEEIGNNRIDWYKDYKIEDQQWVDHFVCDAMRRNIITSDKIKPVLDQWDEPEYEDFSDRTLWSLNNAFTNVMKRYTNPNQVWSRGTKLTVLCDATVGLDTSILLDENTEEGDEIVVS